MSTSPSVRRSVGRWSSLTPPPRKTIPASCHLLLLHLRFAPALLCPSFLSPPSPPPRALQPLVLKGEQWTYHTAPANSRSESMTKRPTDHNPFRTLRCLRSKETSYSRHWQIPALTKIYLAGSSLTASPFKAIRRQNRYKWIPG